MIFDDSYDGVRTKYSVHDGSQRKEKKRKDKYITVAIKYSSECRKCFDVQ